MSRPSFVRLSVLALALVVAAVALGQGRRMWGRRGRPEPSDGRRGVPNWSNDGRFQADVFTFVRVRYSSFGGGWYGGGNWAVDYPDSDLNFSYRLHELTSLEVDPNGKILDLTDDAIFDYPFLYLIEPGRMSLAEPEVQALRRYLLQGGFLMVDDFWGDEEWRNFYREIKRVFPDREPVELPLEHEIFHIVYDLKQKPQVPSIHAFDGRSTSDRPWDPGSQTPHYRALFDDKGRMMAIICHNTDLGDGWEQEGQDPEYFRLMSEKWSYPMGINIVTYAMTH
ncbi:MAG: DUF4159 domain-containing protein [Planctomycetaceae bacterium]